MVSSKEVYLEYQEDYERVFGKELALIRSQQEQEEFELLQQYCKPTLSKRKKSIPFKSLLLSELPTHSKTDGMGFKRTIK